MSGSGGPPDKTTTTFFFSEHLKSARHISVLLTAIEEDRVTLPMIKYAFAGSNLDAKTFAKRLVEPSADVVPRMVLHELFRHAPLYILKWLVTDVISQYSKVMRTQEPVTLSTPLHAFAQRAPRPASDTEYWTAHRELFVAFDASFLAIVDDAGLTPLQYLAALSANASTYDALARRNPELRTKPAETAASAALPIMTPRDMAQMAPEVLRSEKLAGELREARLHNKLLTQQLEAAHDSINLAEAESLRLQKLVATEHVKIDGLQRQLGHTRMRKVELTRQEIQFAGLTDETEARIRELTSERDAAQSDAKAAREQFNAASGELKTARESMAKLTYDRDEARVLASQAESASKKHKDAREELTARMITLEAEQRALTIDATESSEQRERKESEMMTKIRTLASEMESADLRCDAAERECERAVRSLKSIDAELKQSQQETDLLQVRFEAAKSANAGLQEALRVADDNRRYMENEIERMRIEHGSVMAEKMRVEREEQELRQRTSEQQRLLESELVAARALVENAESKAEAEKLASQEALARIEDAEQRASQAASMAEAQQKAQEELAMLQSNFSQLMTMHEHAQSTAQTENNKLNAELEKLQRDLDEARATAAESRTKEEMFSSTYVSAMEELRRERDEKDEQLRIALQKNSESAALVSETRERKEEEIATLRRRLGELGTGGGSIEGGMGAVVAAAGSAAASSVISPTNSRPTTPRRGANGTLSLSTLKRRQTVRGSLLSASSGAVMATAAAAAAAAAVKKVDVKGSASTTPRPLALTGEGEEPDDPMDVNVHMNRNFFEALASSCAGGDWERLARIFELEISPNSREPKSGRSLLEVAVRAANDTMRFIKASRDDTLSGDLMQQVEKLNRTIRLLIEHGGEWDGIDQFIQSGRSSGECALTPMTIEMIEARDDMSPFVRALLLNDPTRAGALIEKVQNLDRVPRLRGHAYEKLSYSFMHLAVLCASRKDGGKPTSPPTSSGSSSSSIVATPSTRGRFFMRLHPGSTSSSEAAGGFANDTMVLLLVRAGASCDTTDANECTPLHLALVESKHMQTRMFLNVVEYLLAGGADPEETCRYEKFIDRASGGATRKKSTFGIKKGSTVKEKEAARSEIETKYNTPLKWAQQRNDAPLLNLLNSRRYRRVELSQLLEYINESVRFACRISDMHVRGDAEQGDELDRLCTIYAGVFQWFNLRYEAIFGRSSVLKSLYGDAGLDFDREGPLSSAAAAAGSGGAAHERHPAKLEALFDRHLLFVERLKQAMMRPDTDPLDGLASDALPTHQRSYLRGLRMPKRAASEVNASPMWKVTETLVKCIEAARKRHFEVSDLIYGPATELFPVAALEVLHKLVREDSWREMASMIGRADMLYGNIQVDTIIVADRRLQCIDVAVQHGSIRCLEWLMERHRARVSDLSVPGPCGATLVALAMKASFAISLVVIDNFRWLNKMSAEKNPNALNYGVKVEGSESTVLHQCALSGRVDLMRTCIDFVQYHVEARSTNGAKFTPLELAQTRLRNCNPKDTSADGVADRVAAQECVRLLKQYIGEDMSESADSPLSTAVVSEAVAAAVAAAISTAPRTPAPVPALRIAAKDRPDEVDAELAFYGTLLFDGDEEEEPIEMDAPPALSAPPGDSDAMSTVVVVLPPPPPPAPMQVAIEATMPNGSSDEELSHRSTSSRRKRSSGKQHKTTRKTKE